MIARRVLTRFVGLLLVLTTAAFGFEGATAPVWDGVVHCDASAPASMRAAAIAVGDLGPGGAGEAPQGAPAPAPQPGTSTGHLTHSHLSVTTVLPVFGFTASIVTSTFAEPLLTAHRAESSQFHPPRA